ncbi:hypothetical protein LX87_02420 [Larkinella arboricola]|uniref:Outer membrane protein assembly factor BamA n=1 Tax=Larkinella arboricola TaxID=643671 RepID=A0A327X3I6_LARAB|nr:hypothetical protein [Larkinella arboricola]RAJ97518.1 hypothetical protein LX87_02420 [Larkinella arboricola]
MKPFLRHVIISGTTVFFRIGWLVGCWLLVTVSVAQAQKIKIPVPDTQADSLTLADSLAQSARDSALTVRDSVFYTNLKKRMSKRKITRELHKLLFHDMYNSRIKTGDANQDVNQIEINPFARYRGRIISNVYIRRLEVFGPSVYDTLRQPRSWLERFANRLHADTREGVIRKSFLLFEEGDRVNPDTLRDNERLLRSSNVFHDARIIVVPHANSRGFVDVYVITQDVWSLIPSGSVGGLDRFDLRLDQRNFRGLAHTFSNQVSYNARDPYQQLEYRGRYLIPYIGKTFLTGQADLMQTRELKQYAVRVYRPFLTPDTRWAGSAELSYNRYPRYRVFSEDSLQLTNIRYFYNDVWAGYAFKPFFSFLGEGDDRTRLVVAARFTRTAFDRRPEVRSDTNQFFQNTNATLFTIGLSRRRYTRDVLIYGFGRTEDVPYGSLASIVFGYDNAELGQRQYLGFKYSKAHYLKSFGYLYGSLDIGGFIRNKNDLEQGVLSVESSYFTPLRTTTWGNWRHFINLRYTMGAQRFDNEFLTLSGRDRIGINNDNMRGTKLLLTNIENILFSRLNIVGFRVAIVTFANLGLASYQTRRLWQGPLYQGYGVAFRLRNENLTFNSFQIRLAWYPNIPGNSAPLRPGFEGVPTARFRDFAISAPEIIPFR